MLLFDTIFESYDPDDHDHHDATQFLEGMCWGECEVTEQDEPRFSQFIVSSQGVDMYYCYGADHYWFADSGVRNE